MHPYIHVCNIIIFFRCLDHPWIKEDGEAPDTLIDNAVLGRLKQFRAMNQFKKAALRVLTYFVILFQSSQLSKSEF